MVRLQAPGAARHLFPILGVASGDRPDEYPALDVPFAERGARFRASFDYIRRMGEQSPAFQNAFGNANGGMDMLPKPSAGKLPLLITGGSQQDPDWFARHGDGWITYPRGIDAQATTINDWRARIRAAGRPNKPAMQSLYVDLVDDPMATPLPIHLGFRLGAHHLRAHLQAIEAVGINDVALNLRFN